MRGFLVGIILVAAPLHAVEPLAIQDNSFLIEEAYNLERGVVQHIFTFSRDGGESVASFTQEWPVTGQRHQFSYTIPVQRLDGESRIGDMLINYRYQLVGDGAARVAVSPRASLVAPTGDSDVWGYELNLPVSVALGNRLVTHWNAGLADNSQEDAAYFAGVSLIAAVREKFHLILETRWTDDGESEVVVSPGVRWAWDRRNGFQVVPGIAAPIGDDTRA
ncbi:MAG: transporter, partial [Longimicrobiales bacterium]